MSVGDTEKLIKEKLEASGQLAKMRAMVVEASLRVLSTSDGDSAELFAPSPTLVELKSTDGGVRLLSIVLEFLESMGLEYTASVLKMEAALSDLMVSDRDALLGALHIRPITNGQPAHTTSVLAKLVECSAAATVTVAVDGPRDVAPSTQVPTPLTEVKPANRSDAKVLWSASPKAIVAANSSNETSAHHSSTSESANSSRSPSPQKATEEATHAGPPIADDSEDDSNRTSDKSSRSSEAVTEEDTKANPEGTDTTFEIGKWTGKSFYRQNQVVGQQLQLEELRDCKVYVLDALDSLMVDYCEGGELVVAACEGSVFLRNCNNMTVTVACKQLRLRDCVDMELRLFASTDPVVESSHRILFKPHNVRLPGLTASLKTARLDPKINRFVHVYDFTADDQSIPKPHFTVLYPNHGLEMVDLCAERGKPECPVEIEQLLAGVILPGPSSETGLNKSYDIKSGSSVWSSTGAAAADDDGKATPAKQLAPVTAAPLAVPKPAAVPMVSAPEVPPIQQSSPPPPPTAPPINTATAAATSDAAGEDTYSSFDDNDDESANSDDHMDVDEDDDEF